MFARFDENPAMTLRVIKETKRYRRTDGRTDARTDGRKDNVKTVYPLQTKFAGGINRNHKSCDTVSLSPITARYLLALVIATLICLFSDRKPTSPKNRNHKS